MPRDCRTGVASGARKRHLAAMTRRSPLDDPAIAAYAWARYKRLMRWMFGWSPAGGDRSRWRCSTRRDGLVSIHFYIATALGVGFAMLLMAALMGLVFLSSGTGHDESVVDPATRISAGRLGDGRSR